ncbi:MAG: GGDEF domain-containing protein [Proteobacteria bacterium]|nr:GGDEF domain-containing protein [Pseudomonadota bacterium]
MRVPTPSTATLLGIAAGCFGIAVIAGWLIHAPFLITLRLDQDPVPFNAGIGLVVAGFAWAWVVSADHRPWLGAGLLSGAVILIGAAVLAEIAMHRDLGIDWPGLHRWFPTGRLHPGRVSAPTCLWFVLFGGFLILFQARSRRVPALCLEPLAFLLLLLGMVGVVSNWLNIEDLYRWRESPRMALPTALGLTTLAAGAWLGLRSDAQVHQLYAAREEWMLTILAGEILIMMAFVGALAGFTTLQQSLEDKLSDGLRINLENRAQTFDKVIQGGVQTNGVLTSRAPLVRSVSELGAGPNPEATASLESSARAFLLLGFKYVGYRDHTGRLLASAGDDHVGPNVPLDLPDESRLAWDDRGFVLLQHTAMRGATGIVGWLDTAQYLVLLTDAYRDFHGLGATADSVLCAKQTDGLFCFPSRDNADISTEEPIGFSDPVVLALDGSRGLARFIDDRNEQVIAAYAPVGSLGLGLLLKIDLRELYEPVRRELERVLPLLLIVIVIGTVILSAQVTPLASRLRRMATLDGLTGVLNRATYMRMSEHELAGAKRRRQPVSVVMLDADHFKRVNDTYGHDVGDEVLKVLSATCRSALRAVDVVGRLGGEEFAIVLPETDGTIAFQVAEKIRRRIGDHPIATAAGALRVTVSIGVATLDPAMTTFKDLLKVADAALYAAKKSGRNRVVRAGAGAAADARR